MGKKRAPAPAKIILFFIIISSLMLFLPVTIASANSLAPPSVVWFSFDYGINPAPHLLGIQLIACLTEGCERPILLQQYGTCDGDGCMPGQPELTGWGNAFECAANICRSAAYPSHGGNDFKLLVQFSDRLLASEVIKSLPVKYGEAYAWRVNVQDKALSLQSESLPAESQPDRDYPKRPLLLFGLSILVESLVAGICFWRKTVPRSFEAGLLTAALVNLISLPVVWYFFPSLGRFQSDAFRNHGIFILVMAMIYTALLVAIFRSGIKTRRWLIVLTILSLPVTGFFYLVSSKIIHGYYGWFVYAQGLPATFLIITSEVFAVCFEAILISVLSKKSLPLRWIWITSLLMNAASFMAGQSIIALPSPLTTTTVPPPPSTPIPPTATIMVELTNCCNQRLECVNILFQVVEPLPFTVDLE